MLKTITIKGMSCGHCEGKVKSALSELNVELIEISAKNDMAKVEVESEDMLKKVVDSIEDIGYDVIEVI
ncbi:MAG: cation transporter [Acidaminobacteraceae bacterium]